METEQAPDRIVSAALHTLLRTGVGRMSLSEVASEAGVTRVTIYRYFGDKRGLVRAVCVALAAHFQRAAQMRPDDSIREIEMRLDCLGKELNELPRGNLLGRLEEISHRYPEVYREFRTARDTAVDAIFQQALVAAARDGTLREGLNVEVLKTIFWASVVGVNENPTLISSNVGLNEIFTTVMQVFRHGILKDAPDGSSEPGRRRD